jgi:thiamine biosynthesis lipoprotein
VTWGLPRADRWATAASARGSREGLRRLESLEGVEALLITAGDEVRRTGGMASRLG